MFRVPGVAETGVPDPGGEKGQSYSGAALPQLPGRPAGVADAGLLTGERRCR